MKINKNNTPVTQPFLPPLTEFIPYLEQIWDNKWLTNNGPFHDQLEAALCAYLGVEHISLFTNGTIALITALQALRISGEVITTPYSFVATSHSLLWNGIKPVFVDIDPRSYNMDPGKIEAAITPQTTAIMPVHCYGNPCDVHAIQKIADNYGLRVIYDGAHAFAVNYQGQSLLRHGDLSILSFHATKVFNTFEGGAIVSPDAKTKHRVDQLKNFGFADEVTVTAPGINGKMSEINSAFGLLQLKYIDQAIALRKTVSDGYWQALSDVKGLSLPYRAQDSTDNYSYFPVLIGDDYPLSRDALYTEFRANNIMARKYFYPLISNMPMYRGLPSSHPSNLPHAGKMSSQILCLPIFAELDVEKQEKIIQILRR